MLITVNSDGDSKMRKGLMEMMENGLLCDYTITTGDSQLKLHRCVLAATLDYFRKNFAFSDLDSRSADFSSLFTNANAVQKVMYSLYTNEIDLTYTDVADILQIADYFVYSELICGIRKFMEDTLDISKAALYFQLCIQYGFDKNSIFTRVRTLLSSRMHDFLIHQEECLDWGVDVTDAMIRHNIFSFCTPLQMVNYILRKIAMYLSQNHASEVSGLDEISTSILKALKTYFNVIEKTILSNWHAEIIQFINTWMDEHSTEISNLTELCSNLKYLRNLISVSVDSESELKWTKNQSDQISEMTKSSMITNCFNNGRIQTQTDSFNLENIENNNVFGPSVISASDSISNDINKKSIDAHNNQNSNQLSISHPIDLHKPSLSASSVSSDSKTNNFSNSLVVLSPSDEMLSQLMEIEVRRPKPLLKSPQLSLNFYDIGCRMWRFGGHIDFPVQGYMMEKHAWRMGFVNTSLFLFSLTKKKGFEYDLTTKEWSQLSCQDIFFPHTSTKDIDPDPINDVGCPVKSVIPVSMENNLVVLSMSREPRQDRSFWTQQHIYQWDAEKRVFDHVTCVRDERMDLPATKWTVEGNYLVTVKASTMMFGDLQMFNIQHIHVYNAETQVLETHHIECGMKSGLKIFLKQKKLYLLNHFSEYRVYCFETRVLSDWFKSSTCTAYVNCGDPGLEIAYPGLMRASCHAGNSRWVINSNFNVASASLSELRMTDDDDFIMKCHPNPPFLYMTTMCNSQVDKSLLSSLQQSMFHPLTNQNQ